ncbi:hypothetical protein L1987_65249 [Smallanthus sonchifolius]|uniref:Uncharacterized protein n=1 Tax=Smallanthus sonchifolius TaxID=185202 RepID=A0ACB9BTT2_9ASTR|nr:hypothetical protein L1987_65249 [Smallanthus sonchifolius]
MVDHARTSSKQATENVRGSDKRTPGVIGMVVAMLMARGREAIACSKANKEVVMLTERAVTAAQRYTLELGGTMITKEMEREFVVEWVEGRFYGLELWEDDLKSCDFQLVN